MLSIRGKLALLEARAAYDWEVDIFALIFSLLYSASGRREGEDKLWWSPSKKKGCLMLDSSTVSWFVLIALISLGKAFGRLRLL